MEIFSKVLKWLDEGKKAALATVIQKQGSALRGVGSKMGISSDMEMVGSVSGGCVEGAVVQEALKAMNFNQYAIVDYGISDDTAWSVGLACGGQIKILIQPIQQKDNSGLTRELLEKLLKFIKSDIPYCILTEISSRDIGTTAITSDGKLVFLKKKPYWLDKAFMKELSELERIETSGIIMTKQNEIFADFSLPKPRLVIIGAVHIAQALVKMAQICGFSTIIIDPRKAFAKIERFQGVDQMVIEWPTDGLESIEFKDRDYLVTLSHDDKFDLPALQKALDKKVRYIGMLSSRKTRDGRFEQLKHEGFSSDELKRIHAPVGLDVGARSPEEIALSIIAEIISFRYGKVKEL